MNNKNSILNIAKKTIDLESNAIANLATLLTNDFSESVELIYNSKGRVIITGIGKSAIIASKIVATLNSTGTPSVFMHAADAIHGDLGLISSGYGSFPINKDSKEGGIRFKADGLNIHGKVGIGSSSTSELIAVFVMETTFPDVSP